MTLLWDPSTDSSVTGYNIYYGASSGIYTNKVAVGGVTNATISNLVGGVTYYFAATAYDTTGLESVPSNEVSYSPSVSTSNQPPTLNPIANVTINENAGLQTVALSGITSGATNENQTLTVTAVSSNPSLIPNPTVSYTSPNTTGSLSFTPATFGFGSATITVTVNDGQTQNNTTSRSFTVTVNPVNQPPTLNQIANVTINENAGLQIVALSGITSGATNENQTLTVTAVSSNPSLIPNPTVSYTSPNTTGSLSFTPAAFGFGSATITVTVNDGQTQNNTTSQSFTVTVNPVNQAPTLNQIANVTINENAGPQTVAISGITSGATNENQALTVTAVSSNPSLVPNPAVTYTSPNTTGSLSFTPVALGFGSVTITVTVNDGQTQNNTTSRSFTVTVNPVNQAPTLNQIANVTINENAGLQTVALSGITSGATNENQALTVTAVSSNPSLIPNPTVSYTSPNTTGSLSFTPVALGFGSATITVTVNDGQTQNNTTSRTFTVTVSPVNQAPTLNQIANVTINENAGLQTVALSGITSGATNENQTLTVTAVSSNPSLIPNPTVSYTSPNTTGSLSFTPATFGFGSATITVTVNDGQTQNNTTSRSFTVTVNPVNQTPTLNQIANVTINENAGLQTVALSGITSGATNENQTLTVAAVSSNPSLIPNPTVSYTSPNTTGTLNFTPVALMSGSATITVTVNDGQTQNNTTSQNFTVTVNAAAGTNQPTISPIADQSTLQNASTAPIAFTVSEPGVDPSNLIVSGVSTNQLLTPSPTLAFSGTGSNRNLTITPATGQSGNATVTISVSDGVRSNTTSFRLSVFSSLTNSPHLSLRTKGKGRISANLSLLGIVPGKTYSISALPDTGQVFAGWTGGLTSSVPQLSFVLTSNLVLEADFVPSPFIPTAGTYNGLFNESDQVRQYSAGSFSVSVTTRGTYSGRLQIGANRYPFTGRLDLQCHGTNTILRPRTNSLQLVFSLGSGAEADQFSGQLTDGTWSSTLAGDRALFNAITNPAPCAGNYTLVIPGADNDAALPFGHGFATLRVLSGGGATLAGTLADGTRISRSVPVSKLGSWPLYASLYAGSGSVLSWLTFTNSPQSDVAGLLNWIKPANTLARYYPGGFAEVYEAVGSRYALPPVLGTILSLTNATLTFSGGNLASDFTDSLVVAPGSRVTNLSSNRLALSFSLSTGLFTGSATDPSSGKALSFKGVVLEKQNAGFGFLLGTNLSSRVVLAP